MRKDLEAAVAAAREVRVGERIRDLRLRHGLSVRTLAAKSEFSPSFISQVELGQVSPSIASLERIVGVLGVTLGGFFGEPTPGASVVIREVDRRSLTSSWSRAQVESLAPAGANSRVEAVMLTLLPGGHSGRYARGRGDEDFAIIFEGEVTLTLGDEAHVLRRGDAATLRADTPHTWENTGLEPVRIVVVTLRE